MKPITIVIMLVLVCELVTGLGVSPSKTELEFIPNFEGEFGFRVVNDGGLNEEVGVSVSGELDKYITLLSPVVQLRPAQSETEVRFRVDVPSPLLVGKQTARFSVTKKLGGGGISTAISLVHRFVVDVPPKYGRIIAAVNASREEVLISLYNPRNQSVHDVRFALSISETAEIFKLEKYGLSIPANSYARFTALHNISREGEFSANYTITHNNSKIKYRLPVFLGEPEFVVKVIDLNLTAGIVNEFPISVESNWNIPFNARFSSSVYDEEKRLSTHLSPDFILEPYNLTDVIVFIDAEAIDLGKYELRMRLDYGAKSTLFKMPLILRPRRGFVMPEVKEMPWLYIGGGLILLFLVVMVVVMLKKNIKTW